MKGLIMYNYLSEVASLIMSLVAFHEKAGIESRNNKALYSVYSNSSNVMAAGINGIIEELKRSSNLRIDLINQRNLGRCYNEYTWSVKSSFDLPEDFIRALRAAHKIDDGQQFDIGEQHTIENSLFERIITVTVDSSD